MITIIAFIIILSLLIMIHEIGHFVVAKKNGVLVEEFGMGIPPRVWGKKIGETIYSINALPFGGFVKLFGEDVEDPDKNMRTHPRSYLAKSPASRAGILIAGVCMNLVLAIVCYYTLFTLTGFKTLSLPVFFDYKFRFGNVLSTDTVITSFSDDSPAKVAGLEAGEAVIEIDGVAVHNIEDIRNAVRDKPDLEVIVLVKDMKNNVKDEYKTVQFSTTTNEDGKGILGVYITKSATIYYPNKLIAPFQHSYNMLAYTGHTFKEFVKMSLETKSVEPVSSGVAGPVGIYTVVDSIISFGGIDAFLGLIDLTALLSLSLALINIMPLPALDGGRLMFVVYEAIFKKPVSYKIEAAVHKWGMIFFLGLLFLITVKDIRRFIPF